MPAERDTGLSLKLTDGTIVHGRTNLKKHNRLSDVLNSESEPFLVLYDAALTGKAKATIFVNKQQVVWIKPNGDGPS